MVQGGSQRPSAVRGGARQERVGATREAILHAAERLFAEHGVFAVSNRQISEAAGQGNNTAVGYHFGSKADLVQAVIRKHTVVIERLRERLLDDMPAESGIRDWVDALIRPSAEHLATLGNPTWFARFSAQVMTEPELRSIMEVESVSTPSLRRTLDGLYACLPELPSHVRSERSGIAHQLMVHVPAERERALAEGRSTARSSWQDAATGLVDAVVGVWTAPVTV